MSEANRDKSDITVHASGRFLRLLERRDWEFVSRANASGVVILVALTDDNRLLLVEQHREPVRARVIELPAGLVGDHGDSGESLLSAARRELLEETGYEAERFSVLLECPSSPGMSDETVTFVQAHGLRMAGPGGGDDSEDIQLHCVPLADIDEWLSRHLAAGMRVDPKIYAALYWLRFPEAAPPARQES